MNLEQEVLLMKKTLQEHDQRINALEGLLKEKGGKVKPQKELSIKEFILDKKPNGGTEKTLAIGYYLENYQGMTAFTRMDLEDGFRAAKEKVPSNTGTYINLNIEHGFMMKEKEKKNKKAAWTLTNSGVKHVENGFKEE